MTLTPFSTTLQRLNELIAGKVECVGNPLQVFERWIYYAALNLADVGAVEATFESKFLLGKARIPPMFGDLPPDVLSDIHRRIDAVLTKNRLQRIHLIHC